MSRAEVQSTAISTMLTTLNLLIDLARHDHNTLAVVHLSNAIRSVEYAREAFKEQGIDRVHAHDPKTDGTVAASTAPDMTHLSRAQREMIYAAACEASPEFKAILDRIIAQRAARQTSA